LRKSDGKIDFLSQLVEFFRTKFAGGNTWDTTKVLRLVTR
jgi:hypothetical protein